MADMNNLGQPKVQQNQTEVTNKTPAEKPSFAKQQEAREAMEASKKNEKAR